MDVHVVGNGADLPVLSEKQPANFRFFLWINAHRRLAVELRRHAA
jgi:hypothetical protein